MSKESLNKIIIFGDTGRGKTTLAEKISAKLHIPLYSTDDYFYEIKFTKRKNRQESIDQISNIFRKDKWIVEGRTRHLLELGLNLADKIIYLKYENIFSQFVTIIKRHFMRKDESFLQTLSMMKSIFLKKYNLGRKKGTTTHIEFITPYMNKVITFTSFKEIDDFLDSI